MPLCSGGDAMHAAHWLSSFDENGKGSWQLTQEGPARKSKNCQQVTQKLFCSWVIEPQPGHRGGRAKSNSGPATCYWTGPLDCCPTVETSQAPLWLNHPHPLSSLTIKGEWRCSIEPRAAALLSHFFGNMSLPSFANSKRRFRARFLNARS